MKRVRSCIMFERLAIFFLIAYLFCALSYLFFVPSYSDALTNTPSIVNEVGLIKQTVNGDYKNFNFVQLIDRTTLDDDQHNIVISAAVLLLIIFCGFILPELFAQSFLSELYNPRNKQYSYIVFRVFRI